MCNIVILSGKWSYVIFHTMPRAQKRIEYSTQETSIWSDLWQVSARIQGIRKVGMSSLKAGYVKVIHGFETMRNGIHCKCKISSRQVYW